MKREYAELMALLKTSHTREGPTKAVILTDAIERICEYYHIPKRDFVDIWVDFFQSRHI